MKKMNKKTALAIGLGALITTMLPLTACAENRVENTNINDYAYYTDLVELHNEDTYIDEILESGKTIYVGGEEITLADAIDRVEEANKLNEIFEVLDVESMEGLNELTEEEKQVIAEEYIYQREMGFNYLEQLCNQLSTATSNYDKAQIVRKLRYLQDRLTYWADQYGLEVCDKLAEIIFDAGAMQMLGIANPQDKIDSYDFSIEKGNDFLNIGYFDKVDVVVTDPVTNYSETATYKALTSEQKAFVDLYREYKNVTYHEGFERTNDVKRKVIADLLEAAKNTLYANPAKGMQR